MFLIEIFPLPSMQDIIFGVKIAQHAKKKDLCCLLMRCVIAFYG